ncbi:MAG: DegV family EDD domain-containing protein [Anaerotignum sp.]|nr:DegV family EDD domain-containing protein [Anaerotignum sp.]
MKKIILLAETGSDVNAELAKEYGVEIVPMHVSFDNETLDDGTFPVEKIVEYYQKTGKLPKTSGSMPDDFEIVLDRIHAEHPEAQILYLAYSAVTTCSMQSGVIACEDRDYVTIVDTKQVSAGQCNIVIKMAEILNGNPDMTMDEAVAAANELISRANMCFMPDNLEFLRAGGRVSNVAFLGAKLLNLHPVIEILDGLLMATKKYRGKMNKVAAQLVTDYAEKYDLDREETLWLISVIGFSDSVREVVENAAKEAGFKKIRWIQAGGVITTHGGPAAFGMAGFSRKK